ncbi:MAG: hypothetical protein NC133_00870 [Prevotella sp.]|nr:hypothetical protein [Prevotella sp.]
MVIESKFVPQLYAYEDEEAKRILRNLKKVAIKNEYQLVDLGVREYVSVAKLDQKAFRYIEKNGKLYLRESVLSVGGLVQDSVLINLGDFTLGDDETGAELEYLVRVKDAKAKQRARQLQECERIAQATLQKIQKQVKNAELLQKWQDELQESKRFVRLGKADYYQSQVAIIAKFAQQDETLAKLIVEYNQKMNTKNEKWLTQPLKLPTVKNAAERIGTAPRSADIGELDPAKRAAFEQYYAARAPQMSPYLNPAQDVAQELPPAPTIIDDKQQAVQSTNTAAVATATTTQKAKNVRVTTGVNQLKQAFQTTANHAQSTVTTNNARATHKVATLLQPAERKTVTKPTAENAQVFDNGNEVSR